MAHGVYTKNGWQ